ncbi:MAG: hypothetical protein AAGJ93_13645 [Bacteroidota bacterium]
MEFLLSSFPAGPEINALYQRLRSRAFRQLRTNSTAQEDALASAVHDGFIIFLDKLQSADMEVRRPEAFAFEIIKRTYWDYRRRVKKQEISRDPSTILLEEPIPNRQRFANGTALFASLGEPFLFQWYQRLPAEDQQLLDLRCQGYKDHEIAQLLERSHGGIRNRFSKLLNEARVVAKVA